MSSEPLPVPNDEQGCNLGGKGEQRSFYFRLNAKKGHLLIFCEGLALFRVFLEAKIGRLLKLCEGLPPPPLENAEITFLMKRQMPSVILLFSFSY